MADRSASMIALSGASAGWARAMHETLPLDQATPIDLVGAARYRHWPAGDQRPRETCIAFAVAACIELLRAGTGSAFTSLSAQFLYWHMRRHQWPGAPPPGWEDGATKLGYAKEVLATTGICTSDLCPYIAQLPAGTPLEGEKPSRAAELEAARNRVTDSCYLDLRPTGRTPRPPGVARLVYELLARGRPVAIALPKFPLTPGSSLTNWDNSISLTSGEVKDPVPASVTRKDPHETDTPGHAVCIVGFHPDGNEAMGGWFVFRNSIGVDWAHAFDPEKQEPPHVPARGYGAISASYIEQSCWEVLSLQLP